MKTNKSKRFKGLVSVSSHGTSTTTIQMHFSAPIAYKDSADAVRKMREFRGWTQQQLADATDTKQPSIARLEAGKEEPSLTRLFKIAQALGFEMSAPRFGFQDER